MELRKYFKHLKTFYILRSKKVLELHELRKNRGVPFATVQPIFSVIVQFNISPLVTISIKYCFIKSDVITRIGF
jgi:hypothetical protein